MGGGVHLTCDAHFRTLMSYSSQKSCVKIWSEYVKIGGILIFKWGGGGVEGRRNPIRGVTCDVTCDAHFRTCPSYFSQKSCVKIWSEYVKIGGILIFKWGGGGWGGWRAEETLLEGLHVM